MSEKIIWFWPLLHAAWTWPNRKAKTPPLYYFCLPLRPLMSSSSPSVSLNTSSLLIAMSSLAVIAYVFYVVARSTSFEQYGSFMQCLLQPLLCACVCLSLSCSRRGSGMLLPGHEINSPKNPWIIKKAECWKTAAGLKQSWSPTCVDVADSNIIKAPLYPPTAPYQNITTWRYRIPKYWDRT